MSPQANQFKVMVHLFSSCSCASIDLGSVINMVCLISPRILSTTEKNATILKIVKISADFHGRFTSKNPPKNPPFV